MTNLQYEVLCIMREMSAGKCSVSPQYALMLLEPLEESDFLKELYTECLIAYYD